MMIGSKLLQEIKMQRFESVREDWTRGRLTQIEAAQILGICERSFRRYLDRYETGGLLGLIDQRSETVSAKSAPADEVIRVQAQYRDRHQGWNVKHFHERYVSEGGARSYSWVKKSLQSAELVERGKKRGRHRIKRVAAAMAGMLIHQDGSTHQWVGGVYWDLIVTMDDATNEHYSMFFVAQEGTQSSLQGVLDVIEQRGLFASFYSDRGSHYWHTPEAGGKVDKTRPTQFGRALGQLGISMIAAYSPEARGRSERAFRTHQGRLPQELALAGISTMAAANAYLERTYRPAFNTLFAHPAREEGEAFVRYVIPNLHDILCEQFERVVGKDNCVQFETLSLQIPADEHRCHYVKTAVRVHRYADGHLAVFHGPRRLAQYCKQGLPINALMKSVEKAAA
jgi:transposase